MNKSVWWLILAALTCSVPSAWACILDEGSSVLRDVGAGDEVAAVVQGARHRAFFIEGTDLLIGGYAFGPLGLPRVLRRTDVDLASEYEGVPFFRAAGETDMLPDVLYFLVDPMTCEFQPYQIGAKVAD